MYPFDAPEEKAEPDSSLEGIREAAVQVESVYPIHRLGLRALLASGSNPTDGRHFGNSQALEVHTNTSFVEV